MTIEFLHPTGARRTVTSVANRRVVATLLRLRADAAAPESIGFRLLTGIRRQHKTDATTLRLAA
jgi:hypothetical protein